MNLSKGIAVALPGDNDHLALAGLVNLAATVLAIRLAVGGLHVAAEVNSIDLDFSRQFRSGLFRRQSLTDLVREDEGRLVLAVQVAGELEGAMALCPVHEDCDSRENVAQVHLPAREERARRDRELRRASLALEDAAGLECVALKAVALRANGVAARGGPTDRPDVSKAWSSVMRITFARERVRAAAERRKCWPWVFICNHIRCERTEYDANKPRCQWRMHRIW